MKLSSVFLATLFFAAVCFPRESIYPIQNFGAVGDGLTLNTKVIQAAIDSCARNSGGQVYVPPGVFVTGTLQLRSNVNLYLESGAVLKGSANLSDYTANGLRVGLIYTHKADNVSITGLGTIDGNDEVFFLWDQAKKIGQEGLKYVRQKKRFREVSSGIGDGPVVPKDRPFQMIIFSECQNVTLRDVTLTRSPFWTLHLADCDGVVISGLKIWNSMLAPNADGIDLTSCSNVLISDCDIRGGDDSIVLTGYDHHFDLPGYRNIRHDSENINVVNCNLQSRSSGIRIGGLDQNSMKNYNFSNINITNSNRGVGLFLRDQGSIENVTFSNLVIDTHLYTGDWWGQGEPIHLSAIRVTAGVKLGKLKNIKFSNIICKGENGIILYGSEERSIENVTFCGLTFHLADSPLNDLAGGNIDLRPVLDERYQLFAHDIPAFYAQYVENLNIYDFHLEWEQVSQPFFTHGIEIDHFRDVRIRDFRGTGALGHANSYPIVIRNGEQYQIDAPKKWLHKENVK